jgi:DNA invertase Pin-like site-specific DNA recombinase
MGQPGIHLTERDKATIVKLRQSGVTLSEIAYRERLALSTVKRILRNHIDRKPEKQVN